MKSKISVVDGKTQSQEGKESLVKSTAVENALKSQTNPGQKGNQKIIWSNLSWKRQSRSDYSAPCPITS